MLVVSSRRLDRRSWGSDALLVSGSLGVVEDRVSRWVDSVRRRGSGGVIILPALNEFEDVSFFEQLIEACARWGVQVLSASGVVSGEGMESALFRLAAVRVWVCGSLPPRGFFVGVLFGFPAVGRYWVGVGGADPVLVDAV